MPASEADSTRIMISVAAALAGSNAKSSFTVTRPFWSTVATLSLAELHLTVFRYESSGTRVQESCSVSPACMGSDSLMFMLMPLIPGHFALALKVAVYPPSSEVAVMIENPSGALAGLSTIYTLNETVWVAGSKVPLGSTVATEVLLLTTLTPVFSGRPMPSLSVVNTTRTGLV